jgi:hypothetical protein
MGESGVSAGINGNQVFNYGPGSGAVYVFVSDDSMSNWGQRAYVKSPTPGLNASFGWAIDFADEGGKMVVAEPDFRGGGTGAVYIY